MDNNQFNQQNDNQDVNGNDMAEKDIDTTGNETENTAVKSEHMIPKSRFDQVIGQKKEAETALEEIAQGLIEEIPEAMRDLVPDLPTAKKIKWLQMANKKGLFTSRPSSSPDSKRPNGKANLDLESLNPTQKMAIGYGQQ